MLNAFVLTTLDTSTRLGRFISTELLAGKLPVFQNRWISSAVILIFATFLGASEGYKVIWPVFGASNQLVAALALIIVSSYLVGLKRPSRYTLIPAYFMLVTTIGALGFQGYQFFHQEKLLLGIVSSLLIFLAGIIIWDAKKILFRLKSGRT